MRESNYWGRTTDTCHLESTNTNSTSTEQSNMDVAMYLEYPVAEGNFTAQPNGSLVFSRFPAVSLVHQHYTISLFLSCLYIIFLFPVGFIGNILILVVNLGHKGRMTAPDLYFVNLAVADLVLVGDSLIEVFNLKEGYYDNATLCIFMSLFQQVNMYSSVFFLTWMSVDRFVALTGPMGRSVPHARLSCCLIWVSSSLLTVLPFTVAQALHARELHFCFANVSQVQWLEVTLGFLLPFCILGVCYWRIARVLARGGLPQRPHRQKALRMISAAVLVFFVCWLPENVFISAHLLREEADGSTLWHDYPLTAHVVSLAAFSNSCLNPLIYSFLGDTFQDKLRLFFMQNASWAVLHRSASGNSASLPAANTCICTTFKDACKSTQLLQSSYCLQQSVIYPSNPNIPRLLHHTYDLDS